MWIEPLCRKDCGITANVFELTLDDLLKIKEYLSIKDSIEQFYINEQQREMKNNQVKSKI